MKQAQALVVDHRELKGNYRLLTLKAPEIAAFAKPGQFVHVRCGDTLEPLLRRPVSIHKIEADHGRLSLLYHVVGRGTRLLAEKQPGELVDLMGPLGRGFTLPEWVNKAVVVGGGIGAAPLLPLVETLVLARVETTVILGARCEELLIGVDPVAELGVEVITATEDGSIGRKGLVTDMLRQVLAQGRNTAKDKLNSDGQLLNQGKAAGKDKGRGKVDYLYSCGPKPMLKAVAALAKEYDVPGEVSLEERMGCGVGACLACACKVYKQDGGTGQTGFEQTNCGLNKPEEAGYTYKREAGYTYKRVCDHGPVFSLREVVLDD